MYIFFILLRENILQSNLLQKRKSVLIVYSKIFIFCIQISFSFQLSRKRINKNSLRISFNNLAVFIKIYTCIYFLSKKLKKFRSSYNINTCLIGKTSSEVLRRDKKVLVSVSMCIQLAITVSSI